jgi:hypothetical protein
MSICQSQLGIRVFNQEAGQRWPPAAVRWWIAVSAENVTANIIVFLPCDIVHEQCPVRHALRLYFVIGRWRFTFGLIRFPSCPTRSRPSH